MLLLLWTGGVIGRSQSLTPVDRGTALWQRPAAHPRGEGLAAPQVGVEGAFEASGSWPQRSASRAASSCAMVGRSPQVVPLRMLSTAWGLTPALRAMPRMESSALALRSRRATARVRRASGGYVVTSRPAGG